MSCNRRRFLAAAAALPFAPDGLSAADEKRNRLGVVQSSYAIRLSADRAAGKPGFSDPLTFLEHCHELGAGGVQTGIGTHDKAYLATLRQKLESYGMYLEGSIRLPKDRADGERFTAEVQSVRAAGAKVLRTVLFGGRRYEQFAHADDFRRAAEQAWRFVTLAEPIIARHDMLLAIENHKDYRSAELVDLLKRLSSRHVGVCVDTGNSIALLEDPLDTVRTLAPHALTVHLKDMAVAEYDEGVLLAEVPLGEGFLDLPKLIALLRAARLDIRFNLEMITRDPLRVPCLTDKYWATASNVPGRDLARTLAMVRKHKQPLPHISDRGREEQIAIEDVNVRKSLLYARKHLEL
jgi:sugar phosphate isomerase/epimerase